jgi:hypothetical protein
MKKTSSKKNTSTTASPQRWFIDCDQNGHTYLIPAEERAAWEKWVGLYWTEAKGEAIPAFARPTCDNFADITFTNPIELR